MKRSPKVHKVAALAVFLVWVAVIAAMVVNRGFWSGAVPFVLLCSVATMVGTILLSRYWIRHHTVPSYGTIVAVPFTCAFLLCFAVLFLGACRYGYWDVFTLSYWERAKGGFADLILPFTGFGFVGLFPATAIVIYFQKPRESESLVRDIHETR